MLKLLSIARNALVVISGVILYRESLAPMQICGWAIRPRMAFVNFTSRSLLAHSPGAHSSDAHHSLKYARQVRDDPHLLRLLQLRAAHAAS